MVGNAVVPLVPSSTFLGLLVCLVCSFCVGEIALNLALVSPVSGDKEAFPSLLREGKERKQGLAVLFFPHFVGYFVQLDESRVFAQLVEEVVRF